MDVITKRWRGSFTVEATIVVSALCMLIGLTILLGLYGHDRAIIKSTANEMALKGALWKGRYVSPITFEVDYEAMRQNEKVQIEIVVDFKLWRIPVSCTVQSSSHLIESKDLPRNIKETGEEE